MSLNLRTFTVSRYGLTWVGFRTLGTRSVTAIKLREESVIPPWTGGIQCHGWQALKVP